MAWNTYLIFSILLLYECQQIKTLHLTSISVPEVVDVRDVVQLSCSYNMGRSKLNSVKWYKDNQEFFRYAPLMDKQISVWTVEGVNFYKEMPHSCNKVTCLVSLDNLSANSTGMYRCEISADAPEFTIVYSDQKMTIVALPKHDPIITGLKHFYEFGELVSANCTSDMSSPPASITWYLNDEKVPNNILTTLYETAIDMDGITTHYKTLEIKFTLDENRFGHIRGKLFMRCVATIEKVPNSQRQASDLIYIQSDDLNNQRLINSRNYAPPATTMQQTITINVIFAMLLLHSQLL